MMVKDCHLDTSSKQLNFRILLITSGVSVKRKSSHQLDHILKVYYFKARMRAIRVSNY